ncbi:DUF1289 domain-containing protein [Pseudomonas paralcaligenes]|uniref:DUF1289 domain-containing protein n=1 Tax=Pseudomonas paralcaligenes TaxID=2772558 RepID=UPI001C812940|nr:DUF1289 domain-containing protein [Pseudomonas paralcaligenes]
MKNSTSTSSDAVDSPCRRQCCLDDRDMCLGCGRTLAEILEWGQADNDRRRRIRDDARRRLEAPADPA